MNWGAWVIPVSSHVFWGSLALAFLVLWGTSYLEIRRVNRKRLVWRLIANGAATLSLLAMALQPQWLSTAPAISALLITPGTDRQVIKSLVDSLHTASQVLVLEANAPNQWKALFPNFQIVPDAAYLKRHYPEINFLHIAGHGLHEYDWNELDSMQIQPHFSPLPLGIKHLYWPRELVAGQTLHVQGTLAGLNNLHAQLYLIDPGGGSDSVKISGTNEAQFKLALTPPGDGKFLYAFQLKGSDGKILLQEPLAVVVAKPQPLKILALTGTASFETKYLKSWASQNQNGLALRTAISRERYRFEFLNRPPSDLSRVTASLLRQFDLVLLDGKTLRVLNATERQALRIAVAQEGLGVLILPDETVFEKNAPNDFFLNFAFEAFPDLEQRTVKPRWPEQQHFDMTAIPAEPFAIKPAWGMQPLIADEMERLLAACYHRGIGLIGLSLIRDSYRWVLEGNPQLHAAYWSHLLSPLARRDYGKERWNLPAAKPVIVDQPLELTVETGAPSPLGVVTAESSAADSIYLQQDAQEPRRWHATFWPRQAGWYQVALIGGEPRWFYVYEKTNWHTWQAAQKINATQQQAARYANLPAPRRETISRRAQPISLFGFFAAFLISCVFLWIENKF